MNNGLARVVEMQNSKFIQAQDAVKEQLSTGKFGLAIGSSAQLLEDYPDRVEVWVLLAQALIGAGEVSEAIAILVSATELDSTSSLAWSYLGHAQRLAGQLQGASDSLSQAVTLAPSDPDVLTRVGLFQCFTADYASAIETLTSVCALAPNQVVALVNLANARRFSGDIEGSIKLYDSVLSKFPNMAGVEWNRAMAILLGGNFAAGFPALESRHNKIGATPPEWISGSWRGEPVSGRLLVEAEQGFGDLLQFSRFFALASQRCGSLTVRCHPKMASVIRMVEGVASVVSNRDEPPEHSARIQLFSLPGALGAVDPSQKQAQYLGWGLPPTERWLPPRRQGEVRVGITWQGNPAYERDHLRSVAIQKLASLFAVEHVTFYSLQKYDGSEQLRYVEPSVRPIDLGSRLDNSGQAFLETVQAMKELDLIISTDTSTVHLAGALGVPCWVLLPFAPDWRWGLHSERTPWYSNMKLFRQTSPKDWSSVVDRVKRALMAFKVST